MKQKILSLITLVVFGTSVMSAQSNNSDKKTVCPEAKVECTACPSDTAHIKHMKAHRHGQRQRFGQGAQNGRHFGKAHDDKQFGKKQMGKRHGRGMRRNIKMVKSTPKCKCATCVELRKQEQLQEKIDSMRKETFRLQHELDSLRGFTPQKGKVPSVEKKK